MIRPIERIKKALIVQRKRNNKMLSMFDDELMRIDKRILSCKSADIPQLFHRIPLDVFGKLSLDVPTKYPHLRAFFPTMASDEVQNTWTGSHGESLMQTSLAFIKTISYGYATLTGKKIENAKILDYGCGWGRLIRLLYKLAPIDNIYGVDPWDKSIKICKENGIKGNLAISDFVPRSLPFEEKFDLIFAFSVFTHLSEKTCQIVLETLRKYISEEGILLITIRPVEYWDLHLKGIYSNEMKKSHNETGFAFKPHNRPPIDGDITYGDASITLDYIESNFPYWKITTVECNDVDPYQVILFLKPA
jgi:SAM-dependent methyltransferase